MPPFVAHCLELMAPLAQPPGGVRARRMFGGFGLYADDIFIALVAGERLYLKTDATTRPHFVVAGCAPFMLLAKGREAATSYWSVPAEALDGPQPMAAWARLAMDAALRVRSARPQRQALKPSGPLRLPVNGAGANAKARKLPKRPA
ncbi:MAG: TfoX/Sxy family protein [Rubrivivax sp.]|nr:TfoX/Sxy family protein [Rubrivivax sp.]